MNLTAKQLAFCNAILDGKGPSEAYRTAGYYVGSPKVVSVKAQEVQNHPLVQQYIQEQRERLEDKRLLSREEKRRWLAKVVRKGVGRLDRLKAVEIDNRMAGHNAPERVEITDIGDLMERIRKDSPKP